VVLFFDVDRPMRPAGRLVNRFIIACMKRTAYVKDSLSSMKKWEAGRAAERGQGTGR